MSRTQIIVLEQDTVTAFAPAGAGCVEPPTVEYAQHTVEVVQIFEQDDDFEMFGWNDDEAADGLRATGYDRDWELEWTPDWKLVEPTDRKCFITFRPSDKGAVVRIIKATEKNPCGRTAGVYERSRK